jgi:hypothetical protein
MSLSTKAAAALLAILLALIAALQYGRHQYAAGVATTTDHYEAAIARQKAQAAELLAAETAKVLARESELQDIRQKQELQDAQHQQTTNALADRLRRLGGPAGRLRDPNATSPGCGRGGAGAPDAAPAGPPDRAADRADAGGLLSAELSALLRERLSQADQINLAYASCRADLLRRAARPP